KRLRWLASSTGGQPPLWLSVVVVALRVVGAPPHVERLGRISGVFPRDNRVMTGLLVPVIGRQMELCGRGFIAQGERGLHSLHVMSFPCVWLPAHCGGGVLSNECWKSLLSGPVWWITHRVLLLTARLSREAA